MVNRGTVVAETAAVPSTRQTPSPAAGLPASRRDRESLAGTVAVAVLLAGGRWISYLSVGPVYIGDILLGGAIAHALSTRTLRGRRRGPVEGTARGPGPLPALVVIYALIRLLITDDDLWLAARDAAPFCYTAIAYLSARAWLLSGEATRRRTVQLLYWALVAHLGRVALGVLVPAFQLPGPELGGVHSLEIRSDLDTALLGVLAGLSILRLRRGAWNWQTVLTAGCCFPLALALQSRAGLLACCACTLAALAMRSGRRKQAVRTAVVAAAAVIALALLLPSSPAGQRLVATVSDTASSTGVAVNAQGTVHGRLIAWDRVVTYTLTDPTRAVFGAGFGSDFLRLSAADQALGADQHPGVRSPHNYLLTSFARLGTLGLAGVAALLAAVLIAVVRDVRADDQEELASLCVLLVIALGVVAMLGVILESPFGAIPFFWAAGVPLARNRRRRVSRRAGAPGLNGTATS
jgi:O-antigen ligase